MRVEQKSFSAAGMGWGDSMHRAFAGHYLIADTEKDIDSNPERWQKAMARHEKKYANPVTDWVALVVAEAKIQPVSLKEAARRQRETWAKWQRRREERAAQDKANEAVANLPLFANLPT